MMASNAIATAGAPQHSGFLLPLTHHSKFAFGCPNLALPRQRCFVVRAERRADAKEDRSSGDNESQAVLEAFFLGKALAEALTDKLGKAVGEFLSDIGRLQAEQQRQIRDFQEEVQERARLARLKAVRDADADERTTPTRSSSYGASSSSTKGGNGSFVSSPSTASGTQGSKSRNV